MRVRTCVSLPEGLWRGDADGVGAAGVDGGTGDGVKAPVQTDFDGGEKVVAATDDETLAGDGGIAGGEEVDDAIGRKRYLRVE